ncbi:MAG: RtcB family protein, partial [Methanobacteriota archaeon]
MAWTGPLERLDAHRFEIPRSYKPGMRVPGVLFADDAMIPQILSDNAPEQVANVACMPGIVGRSYAMPDIHWGYGFPIGGVAAFDLEAGVVSPGGVGFDINCGVRLVRTDLSEEDVRPRLRELVDVLFDAVPSGVGEKATVRLSSSELSDVLARGPRWAVDAGYGWERDLAAIEHGGRRDDADAGKVSARARQRGALQVGSLGGGNHFLEVQVVDEVFAPEAAATMGLSEGSVAVMVHTGSRGCGHQICTDYLKEFESRLSTNKIDLPDRQLACAPVHTKEAEDYRKAMSAAMHFAWTNRQMITHHIRVSFAKVFGQDAEDLGMELVYDVAHNIAKIEEHEVEGRRRKVYVHRKGATRAFGPRHPEVPAKYRKIGQPVLIPGDMGRQSFVLVGTQQAMKETFGSTC